MTEIEIGRAKRGRRAYSFDDIAIVPSRRTRDPEEVSTAWQIDAYRFELPILAAPMDSVMSPDDRHRASASTAVSACSTSRASGRGTTTRPTCSHEVAGLTGPDAVRRMQEIYTEPIRAELITERIRRCVTPG